MKSERNIKHKLKKNSFVFSEDNYNNNTEQSTNVPGQYVTLDNSRNKNIININFVKIRKKKKKKLTANEEIKIKIKELERNTKSPSKAKKKEGIRNSFIKKIKNKMADNNNKKETKKIKKIKKNYNDDSQKIENFPIYKKLKTKRISIDTRKLRDGKGLEKIFFNTRNLSTSEDMSLLKNNNNVIKKKKHKKKKNQETLNLDISGSKKSLKKILNIKKTKTLFVKKQRNALNLSKNMNLNDGRKFSVYNEDENKANNTIDIEPNKKKEKKKITFKLDEYFLINKSENYNNEENDDFNLLDDYLFKKKHKRIKNGQKQKVNVSLNLM